MTENPDNADRDQRLSDLALEWELRQQQGETVLAADLCRNCPELVEELQQRIDKLARINGWLNSARAGSDTTDHTSSSNPLNPDGGIVDTRDIPVSGTLQTHASFRIVSQHAIGGIGEVLLAIDENLERPVALKRIRGSNVGDPERRQRFWREATITGRLEHPGIVPVHGIGEDESGQPCYVMRFIEGETLATAIQRYHSSCQQRSSPTDLRLMLRQLLMRFVAACNTVAYAHSQGVLHRDLKPSNIMLGQYGETLVVDWGLAKYVGPDQQWDKAENASIERRANSDSAANGEGLSSVTELPQAQSRLETVVDAATDPEGNITRTGTALGTPAFMSPEQAGVRPETICPASDIYSLGATLFVLLTGKAPFDGVPIGTLFDRLKRGEIPSALSVNPAATRPLNAVCCKAMTFDPRRRYASAVDLARDIEHWLGDEPVSAWPEPLLTRSLRFARHHRGAVGATVVIIGTLLMTGWVMSVVLHERHIASLVREIDVGLDAREWTVPKVTSMRELIQRLSAMSPEHAATERERLHARIADGISSGLQEQRLDPDAVTKFETLLDDLAAQKDPRAAILRTALQQRLRVWEPVFALRAPFANQEEILGTRLTIESGSLIGERQAASTRLGLAKETVLTQVVTPHFSQLTAEFERTEDVPTEFGLWLDGHLTRLAPKDERLRAQGYAFVISVGQSATRDKRMERDGEQLEIVSGELPRHVELQILRNGLVQHSRRIVLQDGVVKLTASRQQNQLQVQLNDQQPLVFLDPFPLRSDTPGKYGILLPRQVRLLELSGFRQPLPAVSSPLEQADEIFAVARFDEAMRLYLEAACTASGDDALEARYKSALCLLRLNRVPDAVEMFEAIMAESTGRWSLLAGCQLWAHHSRARQFVAADAVQESIQTRHSVRDLYAMVPAELRADILKSYVASGVNYFLYQPELIRNLELTHAAIKLLGEAPNGGIRTSLIRAYRLAGEEGKALDLALESLDRSANFDPTNLEDACWILRRQDQADRALQDLDRRLQSAPRASFGDIYYRQVMIVERARALIALGRNTEAEKSLRDMLAAYKVERVNSHARCAAWLILGFLQDDRGDHAAAKTSWHKGGIFESELPEPDVKPRASYLTGNMSATVSRLIMLALTEELDDASAALIHQRLTKTLGNNPQVSQFLATFGTPAKEYRKMWLTPRGRDWARKFAYRNLSFADFVQVPVLLTMHQGLKDLTFASASDELQDELLWQFCRHLQDAYARGEVGVPQVMQLVLTWKGTTNILGWAGVAPKLSPSLRSEAAYFAGIRYQRLKRTADSNAFWKTVATDAPAESPIRKLLPASLSPD